MKYRCQIEVTETVQVDVEVDNIFQINKKAKEQYAKEYGAYGDEQIVIIDTELIE
jgi:tetrahydromethanopterin S-methyltransferase subunit A